MHRFEENELERRTQRDRQVKRLTERMNIHVISHRQQKQRYKTKEMTAKAPLINKQTKHIHSQSRKINKKKTNKY